MVKKRKKAKATKRKKTAKKSTKKSAKRKATKKAVSAGTMSVSKVAKKAKSSRTKSDTMNVLATCSGLSRKEVQQVLDNLADLIKYDMGKTGPGVFSLHGLLKIVKVHKPATKARKGINPFTREPMIFKAKPARKIVRVRPLKSLKEFAK